MATDNNNDPLLGNKIAGAILAALLLVFGLPQLTAAIFGGGHHGGGHAEELHLAYGGDIELETSSGGGEEEPEMDLGTMMAEASASSGERRAALCKSCHTFEEGGANGTGPNLWNIVGRPVASVSGFNYSSALQDYAGVWSYERLDCYLKNSQECVPGTSMVQRFPRDMQRAELLVYLGSLSDNPVAPPAPIQAAAEETESALEEAAGEVAGAIEDAAETVSDVIEDGVDAAEEALDSVTDGSDTEE